MKISIMKIINNEIMAINGDNNENENVMKCQ